MAVVKSVKVKARFSVLLSEITMKGNAQNRPGKDGPQQHITVDSPVYELPFLEYKQRHGDVVKVIDRGWQLIEGDPPEVWLGDVCVSDAGIITMSGKVRSNGVATTCGFLLDTHPDFSAESITAANETPVWADTDEVITGTDDASAFPGTIFYVRAYATDGTKTVYSIVKSAYVPIIT